MNVIFRKIAIAVGVAVIGNTPVVAAPDLTINFTGSFARGTCNFSVANVDLGTYAASDFDTQPTTAFKTININRVNTCTSDINMIHMSFAGTAHPNDSTLWNVSNIGGLGIEMQNLDPTPLQVSPGTVIDWPPSWVRYQLRARFSRVSAITSFGAVNVPVTLNFTYN